MLDIPCKTFLNTRPHRSATVSFSPWLPRAEGQGKCIERPNLAQTLSMQRRTSGNIRFLLLLIWIYSNWIGPLSCLYAAARPHKSDLSKAALTAREITTVMLLKSRRSHYTLAYRVSMSHLLPLERAWIWPAARLSSCLIRLRILSNGFHYFIIIRIIDPGICLDFVCQQIPVATTLEFQCS